MKKLFHDTRILDKLAESRYFLSEEILMENAAAALEEAVRRETSSISCSGGAIPVLVVAGSGGNGADGYTLARRLHGAEVSAGNGRRKAVFEVSVFEAKPAKTPLCLKQKERASACGVRFCSGLEPAWLLVDCLFGSGFSGTLDEQIRAVIAGMNALKNPVGGKASVIACDVPSGLSCSGDTSGGSPDSTCVAADATVCMGALKTCLFTDAAADCTGTISTASLGIPRCLFEKSGTGGHDGTVEPEAYLLEQEDMLLPYRNKRNVHKGTFGHAAVFLGGKPGAGITAASAAAAFGAGLTTLVSAEISGAEPLETGRMPFPAGGGRFFVPAELMVSDILPENCTAIAAGMGLLEAGSAGDGIFRHIAGLLASKPGLSAVLDADFFRWEKLPELLRSCPGRLVLTPHPKELAALLKNCGITPREQAVTGSSRLDLVREFCGKYPGTVLLSKGTVSVIGLCPGQGEKVLLYVNSGGTPALAKGGTGDVLAGLVCALLAQGYKPLDAAVTASLVHAEASRQTPSDWGLSPELLIESVRKFHLL